MDYALDQLGCLQFERLVTELLALEAGLRAEAWTGEADRIRWAVHEGSLGPLAPGAASSSAVVVQCVWVRAGHPEPWRRLAELVSTLALARPREWGRARALVVVTNLDVGGASGATARLAEAVRESIDELTLVGGDEICAQIDARGELRTRVPAVLGLRDLTGLIAPQTAQRSSLDQGAARELARVFVATGAYERAREVLAAHRFVVLTGPPEMGKTAIARMVGLAQMTTGWEAHECVRPQDVWSAFDRGRAQVFIADDAFGSTEYRPDLAERWAREMERILRALDDRHWLIWTSRPAPLRAALARLHRERGAEHFPAPGAVLVDAGALTAAEKTLILLRHAKALSLPAGVREQLRLHGAGIVTHRHFTPERIRRLIAVLAQSPPGQLPDLEELIAHELARATQAMATSFAALGDEHRDLLIAMLDTPPGPVTDQELAASLRRHHDGALSRPPAELIDRLTDHFLRVLP